MITKELDISLITFLMTESAGMGIRNDFFCLNFQTFFEVLIIPNKLQHILNARFEYLPIDL